MRALAANAGELAKRINELHTSVDEQTKEMAAQTKEISAQNKRNSIKIKVMAAVVVFMLAVIVLISIGYGRQADTSDRQAETSARLAALIEQQEIVRSQVLCPMFRVFLGGYQPETRAVGPDRDKYEAAFAEMRLQYAVLKCTGDLVPPRSDVVTRPPK